jgi:hypothetical protein
MELPKPRRILLSLVLVVGLYVVLLPAWIKLRAPYARLATAAANHVVFPVLGVDGGVAPQSGRWVKLTYTLAYPRTGGWGRVTQRFLDFGDLPLAVAVALGVGFLNWPRRLLVAAAAIGAVFLIHLGLMGWSGVRLSGLLARSDIPPDRMADVLNASAERATGYGNISTVITLLVVGALAAAASIRRAPRSG